MSVTKKNADKLIRDKMRSAALSPALIRDFISKVDMVRRGETGKVSWEDVGDLDPKIDEIPLEKIRSKFKGKATNLKRLAVIKLNGGLGTSMGLSNAKSLIPVKENLSFLSVIAKQIEYLRNRFSIQVPLILMDSYNTQAECAKELRKYGFTQNFPSSFLQNKVPRITADDLTPAEFKNPYEEWCPPGHGDIYLSLKSTGLLKKLIQNGFDHAFISNGDNLGATVDPDILDYMIAEKQEFMMEMTPKTLADKKGGAIYRKLKKGKFQKLELLETAQVPPEYEHEFSGMGKFRTFSTNNMWISLKALEKKLSSKSGVSLALIVNPKNIEGKNILQLETAMGSAIGNFKKTKGIVIPRDRFAPVKKCEDYLIRRSDAYVLNQDYSLTMNPERKKSGLGENLVVLDDAHYKKMKVFEALFRVYPSLCLCKSLEITGPFLFDVPVTLLGDVKLINQSENPKPISSFGKTTFKDETVHA